MGPPAVHGQEGHRNSYIKVRDGRVGGRFVSGCNCVCQRDGREKGPRTFVKEGGKECKGLCARASIIVQLLPVEKRREEYSKDDTLIYQVTENRRCEGAFWMYQGLAFQRRTDFPGRKKKSNSAGANHRGKRKEAGDRRHLDGGDTRKRITDEMG